MARIKGAQLLEGRPRRVTLQDVARAAGVNITTASDALKGTGRVSPVTREKVQRIAAERNYIPNFAARALVTGRTKTVVVVCGGALYEHYYANIVHRLEIEMATFGYKMMLLRTKREVQEVVIATESSSVDGMIAVDMYHLVEEFLTDGISPIRPCVFIGTYSPEFVDHVTIDLSVAVRSALSKMLGANRQRIAYLVTSDPLAAPSEVRAKTYLATLKAAGREPEIINLHTAIDDVTSRFKAYVRDHGCPDALLCQNDDTAMSAYRALVELGYRVPQDVLLVGCDGLRHMACFETPLSTIVQPAEKVCELAWQFLQARMDNPQLPPQHATVEAHLVVRESLQPTSFKP